jgi:hypothetical protein
MHGFNAKSRCMDYTFDVKPRRTGHAAMEIEQAYSDPNSDPNSANSAVAPVHAEEKEQPDDRLLLEAGTTKSLCALAAAEYPETHQRDTE